MAQAGVKRDVALRTSACVGAPVLYGLRRPTILLPSDWLDPISEAELQSLLAHEVAHVKRRDFLANFLQRLVEIPLFFHPFAWLASRRIALAREELAHFATLLRCLETRGIRFARQQPSPYAGRLQAIARSHEPARLVDTLLCCAVIEARSCERFQLLAEAVEDAELASFYRGLLAAEARHHWVYVELASRLESEDEVRTRLLELAAHEAAVVARGSDEPRMHS